MNERIESLRANRLANELWNEDSKREDFADRAILQYKLDHEAKMQAAVLAGDNIMNRQMSKHSRPGDHRRLAEKLAPKCLKDALVKIEGEIEQRKTVGKMAVGSNPIFLNGPMYRQLTPAEQAHVARAEAAKLKLENLYVLEEDIAPLVVKIFADLRQADNAAEQVELKQSIQAAPTGQRKEKSLALQPVGGFGSAGIAAEIEN